MTCDPGHYAKEITLSGGIRGFQCQKCPEGTYARTAGMWSACVPCDEGEVTDGVGATKCYGKFTINTGDNGVSTSVQRHNVNLCHFTFPR